MEENKGSLKIEQINCMPIGWSGTTVCFIFTNLCFLFWGNLLGLLPEGSTLTVGVTQIGVLISYHICAAKTFNTGDSFTANIFMIFATFFGGVGGLNNILSAIAPKAGIEYNGTAIGYCWIICGLFLLGILPACLNETWITFILYLLAGIALFLLGLVTLSIAHGSASAVVAWLLFIVGVLGLYMTFSAMFGFVGKSLPMGPPVRKKKIS